MVFCQHYTPWLLKAAAAIYEPEKLACCFSLFSQVRDDALSSPLVAQNNGPPNQYATSKKRHLSPLLRLRSQKPTAAMHKMWRFPESGGSKADPIHYGPYCRDYQNVPLI